VKAEVVGAVVAVAAVVTAAAAVVAVAVEEVVVAAEAAVVVAEVAVAVDVTNRVLSCSRPGANLATGRELAGAAT
jgi:hypothetical protein